MSEVPAPVVFTPDNEPYLGRELLYHFDQLICSCMEANAEVAPQSRQMTLSDLQRAACQLIPQSISIALSIRELIRQGYLFGAITLARPLIERAAILMYLDKFPTEVGKWNRGWLHGEAPSLSKMLERIDPQTMQSLGISGSMVTAMHNSVSHGKPDCAVYSLIPVGGDDFAHSPSKHLNSPHVCDDLCAEIIPWLVCVMCMMAAYFPKPKHAAPGT
jgi:hypothetical protein